MFRGCVFPHQVEEGFIVDAVSCRDREGLTIIFGVVGDCVDEADEAVLARGSVILDVEQDRVNGLVERVDILIRRLLHDGGDVFGEFLEEGDDFLGFHVARDR